MGNSIRNKLKDIKALPNLALAKQLYFVFLVVLAFASTATLHIALYFVQQQKESQLIKEQMYHLERVKQRTQNALIKDKSAIIYQINQIPEAIKSKNLINLIKNQEKIVTMIANGAFVIGSENDTSIWIKPLSNLKSIWNAGDSFSYLVTHERKILTSNGEYVNTANQDESLSEFFRRKLYAAKQGSIFTKHSAFENSLLSFTQIENTNLFVVNELNISGHLSLMRNYTKSIYLSFILSCIVLFLFSLYLDNRIIQSINKIIKTIDEFDLNRPLSDKYISILEFDNIRAQMLSQMKTIKEFELDFNRYESIKKKFIDVINEIGNSEPMHDSVQKVITLVTDHLEGELGSLEITIYEFIPHLNPNKKPESGDYTLSKLIAHPLLVHLSKVRLNMSNETLFSVEEAIDFCAKGQPELISKHEARFPMTFGVEQLGFVLFRSDKISQLSMPLIEWIMLSCQLLAYAIKYSIEENPSQQILNAQTSE